MAYLNVRSALRCLTFFVLVPWIAGCSTGTEGFDSIQTDNYANLTLEYFYYLPAAAREHLGERAPGVLILIPGLDGRGDEYTTPEWKQFADENGLLLLSPSFHWDEKNFANGASYQFPAIWSGDALLRILEQLTSKTGIATSTMYFFGFSAGAQYSLRFCLWRPDLCTACVAHASGGNILPWKWIGTKFLVTVGTQDTGRIPLARNFSNAAQKFDIDIQYAEYDTGHALTAAQIHDSMVFLKANLLPPKSIHR